MFKMVKESKFIRYLLIGLLLSFIPFAVKYVDETYNLSEMLLKYKSVENFNDGRDELKLEVEEEKEIEEEGEEEEVIEEIIEPPFNYSALTEPVYREGKLGNYEKKHRFLSTGYGQGGAPVRLKKEEQETAQESIDEYGFNLVVSQKISLDRELKDSRHPECKFWSYPVDLPKTSVVIVFLNEPWTTFIRTIHSVLNTSPSHLLEEIILVDDFSTDEHLKERLDNYIKKFNGLVKLYRNTKHEGLIRSRVIGVKKAKGEVVVILDAHIECVENWLPPLLAVIKADRKAMAVPLIDAIHWDSFEHYVYYRVGTYIGVFEWGFFYKEMKVDKDYFPESRKYDSEPYNSPTHAGGLIAFNREWFLELGGYDENLKVWGGEQYELSFKTWLCGGSIKWVPCSHIGHIYRGPRKKVTIPTSESVHPLQLFINYMRIVEVWLDEFKEHFYTREPYIRKLDFGDISKQLEIKNKLNCKSFQWYMDNVAKVMLNNYPYPPKNKVWGQCFNNDKQLCLTDNGLSYGEHLELAPCTNPQDQEFRLNVNGELSSSEHCYKSNGNNDFIIKHKCVQNLKWIQVGEWLYDEKTGSMLSRIKNKCLEVYNEQLVLAPCDNKNINQMWHWRKHYLL